MLDNFNFWNFEDLKIVYVVGFLHFANKRIFVVDLLNGCDTEITMGVAGKSEMYPHGEGGVRLALVGDGGRLPGTSPFFPDSPMYCQGSIFLLKFDFFSPP